MAESASTAAAADLRDRSFFQKSSAAAITAAADQHQDYQNAQEQLEIKEVCGGLSFRQHMIAGSLAGIAEHVAMFPVDTLKTRVQMISAANTSISSAFLTLIKHEGAFGLYKGIGAMILGAGPSHAVYFAVYEECKRRFEGESSSTSSKSRGYHPIAHMSAGACATIASDAVSTPMDVVKQRLQLKNSPYSGLGDCVRKIARDEGFRAFYASYRTTVLMNIPFTGVHFASYEAAKKALGDLISHEEDDDNQLITHLVAGGAAGALASAVTTPLDVVKTRLQCQGVCGAERFHSSSVLEVAKRIISHEGIGAMFKGMMPRVLFHTPAAAISWSTYEAGKAFLQRWNDQ